MGDCTKAYDLKTDILNLEQGIKDLTGVKKIQHQDKINGLRAELNHFLNYDADEKCLKILDNNYNRGGNSHRRRKTRTKRRQKRNRHRRSSKRQR